MTHEPAHPGTHEPRLGYHVAMLRMAQRIMCDDGSSPEDAEAFFRRRLNREHGKLMRAVLRSVGADVDSLQAATVEQLHRAAMEQIRQIFKLEIKPHANYPPNWEQSVEWVLTRERGNA